MGKVDNIKKIGVALTELSTTIIVIQNVFNKAKKLTDDPEVKGLIDKGNKLVSELLMIQKKLIAKLKKIEKTKKNK